MVPIISGTVAQQTVDQGGTINPFTHTSVSDGNPYVHDTLTISLLDGNGNATDANGTLTLSGDSGDVNFSRTSPGVYVLADQTSPSENTVLTGLNTALPKLTFISAGAATTTFSLSNRSVDAVNNSHVITDSSTTVAAGGASTTPADPVSNVTTPMDTPASGSADPSATSPNSDVTSLTDTPASESADSSAASPNSDVTTLMDTPASGSADSSATSPNIHVTGRVGADQTVDLTQGDGRLVIDRPRQFHGTVNLGSGDIDLNGLARADSISFQNDILSIYGAGRTLYNLHITGGSDFSVEKTSTGVSIYTAGDTQHPNGTLLPFHT